jgi:hypothetical protein
VIPLLASHATNASKHAAVRMPESLFLGILHCGTSACFLSTDQSSCFLQLTLHVRDTATSRRSTATTTTVFSPTLTSTSRSPRPPAPLLGLLLRGAPTPRYLSSFPWHSRES